MKLDLRVFFSHQNFLSHARAAQDYQSILANLCHVVDDPETADVALLHYEAPNLPRLLEDIPGLQAKYLIGYCVWESDTLPLSLQRSVQMMDEIWTASSYCYNLYSRYHPRVTWVPHLIEWSNPPADKKALAELIDTSDDWFNYFTITQEDMGRKNSKGLQAAFAYVAKRVPKARLIMKTITYPIATDAKPKVEERNPSIVVIEGRLDGSILSALYDIAHVYVSAHFAEGWGLPLSDAMVLGTPVVATNYSGNLDFMTPHNSLLVNCTEERIKPQDQYYAFDGSMRWGYPHREHLERQMLNAYRMHQQGTLAQVAQQARSDVAYYNREHIADLIARRLGELDRGIKDGSVPRLGKRS